MKKILYIAAFTALAGISIPGCSLDDIGYPSTATPETAIKVTEDLYTAVRGLYYTKHEKLSQDWPSIMIGMSDMFVGTRAQMAAIAPKYNLSNANNSLTGVWRFNHWTIQDAGNLLADIDRIESEDRLAQENADLYQTFRGQCYFMRAWSYLELVRLWGRLPIHDETVTVDSEFRVARQSVDSVYKLIFRDLDSAIDALPDREGLIAFANTRDGVGIPRTWMNFWVSDRAATGAKALASLTYANYLALQNNDAAAKPFFDQALVLATSVIESGESSLAVNFADNYDYMRRANAASEALYKATLIGDATNRGFMYQGIFMSADVQPALSQIGIAQTKVMPWYVDQFAQAADMYNKEGNPATATHCDPRFTANFLTRYVTNNEKGRLGQTTVTYPDRGGQAYNSVLLKTQNVFINAPAGGINNGFPYMGMYRDPGASDNVLQRSADYPLLRLAEMYLIQAEAMNELEALGESYTTADIFAPINVLRARARAMVSGGTLPVDLTSAILENYMSAIPPAGIAVGGVGETDWTYARRRIILRERDMELCGELRRYLDLIRMRAKDKNGARRTMNDYLYGEYYPSLDKSLMGSELSGTQPTGSLGVITWESYRYTPDFLMLSRQADGSYAFILGDPALAKKFDLLPIPSTETLYNPLVANDQNWGWQ